MNQEENKEERVTIKYKDSLIEGPRTAALWALLIVCLTLLTLFAIVGHFKIGSEIIRAVGSWWA